jgi:NitT/TauT family transport system permease protein
MAADTGARGPAAAADSEAAAQAGLDRLEIPQVRESAGSRGRKIWAAVWPKLLAIAIVLAIWELVHLSGWKSVILPGPAAVFSDLWQQAHHLLLWQAIGTTLRRAVMGFALALIIGVVIGALVSRIKPLRAATGSLITALQTMPSIAWFPLAILLFQLGEPAILFVVVLGAAPSIANGLLDAVDQIPPLLVKAGRSLGARGFGLYRRVVVPAALPGFVNGLKQGWAFSWRSLMAGELIVIIGDRPSIGMRLSQSRELADAEGLLAWMVVVLAIGLAVHGLGFGIAERRMMERRGLLGAAR